MAKKVRNTISVSGDFMLGEGEVSVPLGYSLRKSLDDSTVPVSADLAPRNSEYYGGTISYARGSTWFFDLSYAQGTFSGTTTFDLERLRPVKSKFAIDDQWYQAYIRYNFRSLQGTSLSFYLRAGVTYGEAELAVDSEKQNLGQPIYSQRDSTKDILGNLGFGLGYALYTTEHISFGLRFEGEGFYGFRTQNSKEALPADSGVTAQTATIDNTLYGGLARGLVRFE
jgi:hypothetical protein